MAHKRQLNPRLKAEEFVFTFLQDSETWQILSPLASFQEENGTSLVILKKIADQQRLPYTGTYALITLGLFSDLAMVGLTALVSTALAKHNVPCNMIAAYHHDHILVPIHCADRALEILNTLTI